MSTAALPRPHDVTHAVSPGLWALAWKRLQSDYVGIVSLAIVIVFLVMMVLSATGLVAKDWAREVGVNYAPPTFVGPAEGGTAPAIVPGAAAPTEPSAEPEFKSSVVDPLAEDIAALQAEMASDGGALALGLGVLALRILGENADGGTARLRALRGVDGGWNGNPYHTAIAIIALRGAW